MTGSASERRYWFRAKRYGWGWGLPVTWQGWVVLVSFLALMVLGALLFPPDRELGRYLVFTTVVAALLIAVCWAKGEPPRWRWGGD